MRRGLSSRSSARWVGKPVSSPRRIHGRCEVISYNPGSARGGGAGMPDAHSGSSGGDRAMKRLVLCALAAMLVVSVGPTPKTWSADQTVREYVDDALITTTVKAKLTK